MSLTGEFLEQPDDPHVQLRKQLLDRAEGRLPSAPVTAGSADDLIQQGAAGVEAVISAGQCGFQLTEPMSDKQFQKFGEQLGPLQPERDPTVQPFVANGVILNLVTAHDQTADVHLQPFATNSLSLHSEGSGRPLADQPRYIVLMCCQPGTADTAQTVLVPMSAVADRLDPETQAVLSQTRYRDNPDGPSILRSVVDPHTAESRLVFSFRDFGAAPLAWHYTGDLPRGVDVNAAIRALLAAMYTPEGASAVQWRRGMLAVIDNTRFFHGRTAGHVQTVRRHLKRLRVLTQPALAR
jgi:alpha-ketoglutarate-dependent taurine dioxygenase